jgi:hypothetical protein
MIGLHIDATANWAKILAPQGSQIEAMAARLAELEKLVKDGEGPRKG